MVVYFISGASLSQTNRKVTLLLIGVDIETKFFVFQSTRMNLIKKNMVEGDVKKCQDSSTIYDQPINEENNCKEMEPL